MAKQEDVVHIVIGEDIKEGLKIACAKERTNMSRVVRGLLTQWLEEREGMPQAVHPDQLTTD